MSGQDRLGWVSLAGASALIASLATASASGPQKAEPLHLPQNWSEADRSAFYWTSQGSALISYDIYLALEDVDGKRLFNSPEAAEAYGLLAAGASSPANPDGLAVGVTRSLVPGGRFAGVYMGLTCAACHTGELRSGGKVLRIDGGKTNTFDVVAWVRALSKSLDAALASPAAFDALAGRVRARGPVDEADLRRRLTADAERLRTLNRDAFVVAQPPGAGRMDALGIIQNVFLAVAPAIPENRRVADAPVKIPSLWNTGQSSWVQWSGVSPDSYARNFSESLGVFVRFDLSQGVSEADRLDTSANRDGLIQLEELSRKLSPPKWPSDVLGPLDAARVARGARLFESHCAGCHTVYPYRWTEARQAGKRMIANALVPQAVVGTDPAQLDLPTFSTVPWAETKHLALAFGGRANVTTGEYFAVLQSAMIARSLASAPALTPEQILDARAYMGADAESQKSAPVRSYKAPPMDGLWANAPYLHNGSVPNLFELLSPAAERSREFYVGSEFDPVKVGFDVTGRSGGRRHVVGAKGDSNAGHSFENGAGPGVIGRFLKVDERYDLIEYVKSLPDAANRATPYGGPPNPVLAKDDPRFFNTKHPY